MPCDPAPTQPWDVGEDLAGLCSCQGQRVCLEGGSGLLEQLCRNPGGQRGMKSLKGRARAQPLPPGLKTFSLLPFYSTEQSKEKHQEGRKWFFGSVHPQEDLKFIPSTTCRLPASPGKPGLVEPHSHGMVWVGRDLKARSLKCIPLIQDLVFPFSFSPGPSFPSLSRL